MQIDVEKKCVLVAGGTSGINLGIAKAFAEQGARVFVFSRSEEKVAAALSDLRALNGDADGCVTDVRSKEAVDKALQVCRKRFGLIDIVISGAAGNFPALANDISSNGFRAVMEIDVLGTHHVMTSCYPHLNKPGASIINISAPQSVVAMAGQAHVCAAKAGVDMITRTLALEWGVDGVRVNSVIPGPIADTEGMRRLYPTDQALANKAASVPLRRLGQKHDVASACLFLASDSASFITGAVLPVDGGACLVAPTLSI